MSKNHHVYVMKLDMEQNSRLRYTKYHRYLNTYQTFKLFREENALYPVHIQVSQLFVIKNSTANIQIQETQSCLTPNAHMSYFKSSLILIFVIIKCNTPPVLICINT